MKSLHLNLLNPSERRSASPVRARIILPIIAGLVITFVLVWGGFVGLQLAIVKAQIASAKADISRQKALTAECETMKKKLGCLQAEADQYTFYLHGRQTRGELLKRLAFAIPDGIVLSSLVVPPPPAQQLTRPLGSKLPPFQGPTQAVERVELRLTGLARQEQDVFQLMRALEGNAFTGLVSIVKRAIGSGKESPRVLAFRQEAPSGTSGQRDVFFDIVYDLMPREFVK